MESENNEDWMYIHSFSKYLQCIHHVPDIITGTADLE